MPGTRITITIPCYNEAGNIIELSDRLRREVTESLTGYAFEILFVDDGSTDETLAMVKSLAEEHDDIKYISLSRNFGHQNALKAGIDHAEGDAVIVMDADMQHPPAVIRELITYWEQGYLVVNSRRLDSRNQSWIKRLSSRAYYRILNRLLDIRIEEGSADFRLMDRKVINELKKFREDYLFYRGLIPWLGFRQAHVAYMPEKRFSGEAKYTFRVSGKLAMTGITSFSVKPLRISTYVGLTLAFISLAYAGYALYISLFTGNSVRGWTSVIVSVLFIGSLQLIMLGIIGEYLGKLFIESKQRPNYIIAESKL